MMQKPLFTVPTEWVHPDSFPDLSAYEEISIDLETKDPNLIKWAQDLLGKMGKLLE